MKVKILIVTALGIANLCYSAPKKKFKSAKVDFMVGRWEATFKGGAMVENWKRLDDKTLSDYTYVLDGVDTVFRENITLVEKNGELIYTVVLKHKTVIFRAIKQSQTETVFENPTNDFPRKIIYGTKEAGSLYAKIVGKVKGKPKSEVFEFKKL